MARTRLFVSHSTREPTLQRLGALVDALDDNGAGYDVLIDKRFIETGDQWRERIHVALAECQGAVVLFDEQAMKSPWVLKEATILSWRKDLEDDDFHFLPVRLGNVTQQQLADKDYSPLLLSEVQQAASDDVQAIVDAVRNKIPTELESPTLFDLLTDEIADQLEGLAGGRILEQVASRHFAVQQLTRGEARKKKFADLLARKLFSVGAGCLSEAVRILDDFGRSLEGDVASRILRVLDPMWVEADAASLLAKPRYRALAMCSLNQHALYDFTAESYVARGYPRSNRWELLRVDDSSDDDEVGHIQRVIRSEFREKNPSARYFEGKQLDDRIKAFNDPLFVLLPSVPDDEVLLEIETLYPNITYLMYTTERGSSRGPLKDTARYIDPELTVTSEELALAGRDNAARLIRRLSG